MLTSRRNMRQLAEDKRRSAGSSLSIPVFDSFGKQNRLDALLRSQIAVQPEPRRVRQQLSRRFEQIANGRIAEVLDFDALEPRGVDLIIDPVTLTPVFVRR